MILPYSGAHPDHHAWYQDPDDSDFILNGNDGGINISRDGGETWSFVHNLPVGQFYHINVDNDIPYNVYGGLQDNGSWKAPAYVWHGDGIRNEDWQEISFGDGFDVVPMPGDVDMAYAMSQGNVYRLHIPTGAMAYIQPNHPDTVALRYNWNAAIAVDPHDPNGVYFGSQFVHYSAGPRPIVDDPLAGLDDQRSGEAEAGRWPHHRRDQRGEPHDAALHHAPPGAEAGNLGVFGRRSVAPHGQWWRHLGVLAGSSRACRRAAGFRRCGFRPTTPMRCTWRPTTTAATTGRPTSIAPATGVPNGSASSTVTTCWAMSNACCRTRRWPT